MRAREFNGQRGGWTAGIPAIALAVAISMAAAPALAQTAENGGVSEESWLDAVSDSIESAEYHASWRPASYLADVDEAWQAPNRAQGFRTYFLPEGTRVVPRVEAEAWDLAMSLVRWGRTGGTLEPVAASSIRVDENRVELDRGAVVEWYVNGDDGLKQGFTIDTRPRVPRDESDEVAEPSTRPASTTACFPQVIADECR